MDSVLVCFPLSGRARLRPRLCSVTWFLKSPVTPLSRSDMMRSDGSFLQSSSLPLIHPYHRENHHLTVRHSNPPRILELTSQANRAGLIKDHLASVQISLIECQSGMFAWRRGESGTSFKGPLPCTHKAFVLTLRDTLGEMMTYTSLTRHRLFSTPAGRVT